MLSSLERWQNRWNLDYSLCVGFFRRTENYRTILKTTKCCNLPLNEVFVQNVKNHNRNYIKHSVISATLQNHNRTNHIVSGNWSFLHGNPFQDTHKHTTTPPHNNLLPLIYKLLQDSWTKKAFLFCSVFRGVKPFSSGVFFFWGG